jgi:hypothetical protein
MAHPQPYFYGLTVNATWDGEISHAVDFDIIFEIDAIPNSRLRLISLEAATHAEMTGANENSPATTYSGEGSTFLAQEVQDMATKMDRNMPSAITDLSLDPPSHINHASRIPLPLSRSRSMSPRKRPLPIAQRPPWRSPAFKDATKPRGRPSRVDESKSMTSDSADGSCSPTKAASENFKIFDSTRRGREVLRAEVSRRASYRAFSGQRTAEGTPEQKVTEWLDQNEHAPMTEPVITYKYGSEAQGIEQNLGASLVIDARDEQEKSPPSPTPSSQAIVPWTSVRYRNPLRLRGAGSCAASLEKFNGFLYAVFPHDVVQVVHRVQIRARVHLRTDSDNGGHLLELPGLPTQDETGGCFTLFIVSEDEGEFPTYKKIAHVDKDFGTNVLTGPLIDLAFNADAPLSIKFLRFEDGVQVLKEADFEIDYDVRTYFDGRGPGSATKDLIGCKHLIICSLRLRDFLIWTDHLQVTIFISGGPVSVLRTESVTGDHQIHLCDQRKDGHEREVTVTIKAAEITRPFGLVFERTPGAAPFRYWVPRISRSRRLAEDIRAQRENIAGVEGGVIDRVPAPELKISEVISTCQFIEDTPIRAENSDQGTQNPRLRKAFPHCRSIWCAMKLLFMAYLVVYYVTIQFGLDRQWVEDAKGRMADSLHSWMDLAVKMSEQSLGHQIEVEEEMHQQIEEERHQQSEEDLDERQAKTGPFQPPMQGLSLRDKVDRALGWKGPTGDW